MFLTVFLLGLVFKTAAALTLKLLALKLAAFYTNFLLSLVLAWLKAMFVLILGLGLLAQAKETLSPSYS